MEPVRLVEGTAVPLDRSDVDTDQIIPAEYLKRVTRHGYEDALFSAWRKDPDFVLNQPAYSLASSAAAVCSSAWASSKRPCSARSAARAVYAPR